MKQMFFMVALLASNGCSPDLGVADDEKAADDGNGGGVTNGGDGAAGGGSATGEECILDESTLDNCVLQ